MQARRRRRARRRTGGGARRHQNSGEAPASVIGAYGPDPDENRAFLSFSRSFRSIRLPVPEIYADDEPRRIWLEAMPHRPRDILRAVWPTVLRDPREHGQKRRVREVAPAERVVDGLQVFRRSRHG